MESEYYVISEAATEMIFMKQILDFWQIEIALPMKLKVDNVGAIYLANNQFTGQRTKHIDVRWHYVRNLIQDEPKLLEIEFVKSDDNKADTYTKNVNGMLFEKHTETYMDEEIDEQQKGGC